MRLLSTTLVLIATIACGHPPLANVQPSSEALATSVLDALALGDDVHLRGLALNEREFRQHVWPSLPVSRPERNVPFGYVWGDLKQKSDTFLSATLAAHGGHRYDFLTIRFAAPATQYASFRVHPDPVLVVRDSRLTTRELRLCGSFLEKDGVWKVFSYVVDD